MIDGGRKATYGEVREFLAELPESERDFELLVVTHVDRDHIEGVIAMLADQQCPVTFQDIWFNGYAHLTEEAFGPPQGDSLTELLMLQRRPWNRAWGGGAVRVADEGALPRATLAGGLELTVLSPNARDLLRLRDTWERECEAAGLVPNAALPAAEKLGPDDESFGPPDVVALAGTQFEPDRAPANGSSIALLARWRDRSVLLAADAYPERLVAALERLQPEGPLVVNAFKVPHHGSDNNLSRELLARVRCARYLVSTNGSYHGHPGERTMARIMLHGGDVKELVFNYQSPQTRRWGDPSFCRHYGCTPIFGAGGFVRVEL
jgi:hypothetical protein